MMNRDSETPRWIIWGWLLMSLLALFIVAALWGGRFSRHLDVAGLYLRVYTRYPVRASQYDTITSPDGKWVLNCVDKQWTYGTGVRFSTDELFVFRNGRPFLGGANLNTFPLHESRRVFLTNSLLMLDRLTTGGLTTATMVVRNDTATTIPYLAVQPAWMGLCYCLFELPPRASERFTVRYRSTSMIQAKVGLNRDLFWKPWPSGAPPVSTATLVIGKGGKPELTFAP